MGALFAAMKLQKVANPLITRYPCYWNSWLVSGCYVLELVVLPHCVIPPLLLFVFNGRFALIANSISGEGETILCDVTAGDIFLTQCSLPKAVMGIDIVVWWSLKWCVLMAGFFWLWRLFLQVWERGMRICLMGGDRWSMKMVDPVWIRLELLQVRNMRWRHVTFDEKFQRCRDGYLVELRGLLAFGLKNW